MCRKSSEKLEVQKVRPTLRTFSSSTTILAHSKPLCHVLSDTSTDARKSIIENDPTLLSLIDAEYDSCVTFLLNCTDAKVLRDVDEATLKDFQSTHGNLRYLCRYRHCAESGQGFTSPKARAEHEARHSQVFKCLDAKCAYQGATFKRARDWKAHELRWHTNPANTPLPPLENPARLALEEKQLRSLNFEGLMFSDILPRNKAQGSHDGQKWWVMYNADLPRPYTVSPSVTLDCNFQVTCICFIGVQNDLAVGLKDGFKIFSMLEQTFSPTIISCFPGGESCPVQCMRFNMRAEYLITGDDAGRTKV